MRLDPPLTSKLIQSYRRYLDFPFNQHRWLLQLLNFFLERLPPTLLQILQNLPDFPRRRHIQRVYRHHAAAVVASGVIPVDFPVLFRIPVEKLFRAKRCLPRHDRILRAGHCYGRQRVLHSVEQRGELFWLRRTGAVPGITRCSSIHPLDCSRHDSSPHVFLHVLPRSVPIEPILQLLFHLLPHHFREYLRREAPHEVCNEV